LLQLEKHEDAIRQIQGREQAVKHDYQSCLERCEAAEGAKHALEVEHRRVQAELREQELLVAELERSVVEERKRRGEEVGGLKEMLRQEQEQRHQEVITSSQLISELKEELTIKVPGSINDW
jgi:hypothetical protein